MTPHIADALFCDYAIYFAFYGAAIAMLMPPWLEHIFLIFISIDKCNKDGHDSSFSFSPVVAMSVARYFGRK